MKSSSIHWIVLFVALTMMLTGSLSSAAGPGRMEMELSGDGWHLWLDRKAEWKNDRIYMPQVNISSIPVIDTSSSLFVVLVILTFLASLFTMIFLLQ